MSLINRFKSLVNPSGQTEGGETMQQGLFVKVAKLGSRVNEVFLATDHPTVDDALSVAGERMERGWDLRVNGESASKRTRVHDGDIVTLIPRVRGG